MNLLTDFISTFIDPMQFAYRSHRSCSDAIRVVLEKLYSHLERTKNGYSASVVFFNFSSASDNIQPHVLINKLLTDCDVPKSILTWVLDYLKNRTRTNFFARYKIR